MSLRLIPAILFFFQGVGIIRAGVPIETEGGLFALSAPPRINHAPLWRYLEACDRKFESQTGFSDTGFLPVQVVLHPSTESSSDFPSLHVDEVEGETPRILINQTEGKQDSRAFRYLVANALLLREYYGNKAPLAGTRIKTFPDWVIHGISSLIGTGSSSLVIPVKYLNGETPPSVVGFVQQKAPDDSAESLLQVYDIMSSCLLSAGLKDHAPAFRDWIGHFDPQKIEQSSNPLPKDWDTPSVERLWLLLMAGHAQENNNGPEDISGPGESFSLLSIQETIHEYDLVLEQVAQGDSPVHSLAGLRKKKGFSYTAKQLKEELERLRFRANPLAVPLIDKTIILCSRLSGLPEKKVIEEERKLSLLRVALISRTASIQSYLDWYEAAKEHGLSGLFHDLLQDQEPPRKKGPIGRYLDEIESMKW